MRVIATICVNRSVTSQLIRVTTDRQTVYGDKGTHTYWQSAPEQNKNTQGGHPHRKTYGLRKLLLPTADFGCYGRRRAEGEGLGVSKIPSNNITVSARTVSSIRRRIVILQLLPWQLFF